MKVTNIAAKQLSKIPEGAPVISISDVYSPPANIPGNRRVLRLSFFAGDHLSTDESRLISKEQVADIFRFIEAVKGDGSDHLFIQCGEGRIRSYTLMVFLVSEVDGLVRCGEMAAFPRGIIDLCTISRLSEFAEELGLGSEHRSNK